jgi:ADP-dependent phosphofructokinase/glucokinase
MKKVTKKTTKTTKSPPMALVKTEDLDKLLNGAWQISNDLDELSYRFDEVSQLLDSVHMDFDDGKAACFFYLSERLYNENKKQLEEILQRLGQVLWEARGIRG